MAEPGRVVVIGATGILRPAVQMLLIRGTSVVAIARDATALTALATTARAARADVVIRAVDARDPAALAQALDGLSVAAAIAYDPAVSSDSWTLLARRSAGPVVQVVTSSAADPSRPKLPSTRYPFKRLVLGWTDDGRWHTPAEVSVAAIRAWREAGTHSFCVRVMPGPRDAILGRVRPWSQRPV